MKPNILLITSDQQHWDTLGRYNSEIDTPNLDRLAEEGTVFRRAYCPNPTCTPTRASMITGKYPSQHGAYALGTKLSEDERTIGDELLADGYRTALVGKGHFQPLYGTEEYPSLESYPLLQDLDFWRAFDERFYGFEHVELARNHTDEAHVGQHYAIWMEEKGLANWREYFRPPTGTNPDQKRKWLIPEAYHYGTWIAERSASLLEAYAEEEAPFFLWASFFDPHPDYLVPEPWDTMYDPARLTVPEVVPGEHAANPLHFRLTQEANPDFSRWEEAEGHELHGFHSHLHQREELAQDIAIYYGMISLMDKQIGRILDRLDELGLRENTLVVFTSDHGHFFGQHGLIAKGAFHYEDLIRVPLIARFPGRVPAGAESNSMQSLVDFTPSFLSIAGVTIPREMSGLDQSPVWFGQEEAVRDHVMVENRHQPTRLYAKSYVDHRYKITVYRNHDDGEIFDLENDPREVHNLWQDPACAGLKRQLMLKMLQAEMMMEPAWMPRIAQA